MNPRHGLLVLLLAIIAAALVLLTNNPFRTTEQGVPETSEPADVSDLAAVREPTVVESDTPESLSDESTIERCLTPWQVESHPLLMADAERVEPVMVSGSTMEAYRNQATGHLESLAAQGDSAAMAVLGAIHLLKARDMTSVDPVSLLVHDDNVRRSYRTPDTNDPEVFYHLGLAREWFYRAALNGRLFALYRVGEVDNIMLGGPVGLGWISAQDYDALDGADRGALLPENIYNQLALEIAPELRSGITGYFFGMIPKRDIQAPILESLAQQFENDRIAAGLPPIDIPESNAPSFEELADLICDEYKDERYRDLP